MGIYIVNFDNFFIPACLTISPVEIWSWRSGPHRNEIMSNIMLMFTLLLWYGVGLKFIMLNSPLDYIADKACSPKATVKAHTVHECLTKCFTMSSVLTSTSVKVSCRNLLWDIGHGKDSGWGTEESPECQSSQGSPMGIMWKICLHHARVFWTLIRADFLTRCVILQQPKDPMHALISCVLTVG